MAKFSKIVLDLCKYCNTDTLELSYTATISIADIQAMVDGSVPRRKLEKALRKAYHKKIKTVLYG